MPIKANPYIYLINNKNFYILTSKMIRVNRNMDVVTLTIGIKLNVCVPFKSGK